MSKASAERLGEAGFKYIGKTYQEMDCQAFFEKCLQDAGITEDLKGSNAWYRKIRKEGWVGTPEECKARFGSVPKGAVLFIHVYDGGEEKRGYRDGLGNAKHIGIKTGTGEGAIHSSESRGGVFESKFKDKTIPNGGWNCVGLWPELTYGEKIDKLLAGGSGEGQKGTDPEDEGGDTVETAVVWSANGTPVHMRASNTPGTAGYRLYDDIPVGTSAEVLEHGDKWCRVNCGRRKGWYIMTEFLLFDGAAVEPGEDPGEPAEPGTDDPIEIRLTVSRADAQMLLRLLDSISWQLVQITGGLG